MAHSFHFRSTDRALSYLDRLLSELSSIATGSLAFYQGANSRDLQDILLPAKAGMLVLSLDLQHQSSRCTDVSSRYFV
jgi:hypothetical protein